MIDGLPLLYLTGLATAMSTDGRQRVGDLAARTQVFRRSGDDIRGSEFALLAVFAILLGGFGIAGLADGDGAKTEFVRFDTTEIPEFDFSDGRVQPIVDSATELLFAGEPDEVVALMPDGVIASGDIVTFQRQVAAEFGEPSGDYVEMSAITLPAASLPQLSDGPLPVRQLVYATSFSKKSEVALRLEIVQIDDELLLLGFFLFEPVED